MTGNNKCNKKSKNPSIIEIECVCKRVEKEVDQDDGGGNIRAKR